MNDKIPNGTDIRHRRDTDNDDRILDKILGFERATHDQIAAIAIKVILIEAEEKHILTKIDTLVSKLEFTPVKLLVYGTTAIILTAVIGALVALVVRRG